MQNLELKIGNQVTITNTKTIHDDKSYNVLEIHEKHVIINIDGKKVRLPFVCIKGHPEQLSNKPSENAKNFYNQAEPIFENLYFRWQDESEYEDIKDYKLPLLSVAEKNSVEIIKMNKRPFGCIFKTDGKTFKISYTSKSYKYEKIS